MDHLLRATDVAGKSVLVRLDLDLSKEKGKFDLTRLEDGLATLRHLLDHNVIQITVIAHMGRPEGKKVASLSLKPIEKIILKKLSIPKTVKFSVLENLRFDKREEAGSMPFARELAKGHDLFVNDAFASSHREHTSITFIPKILPSVFGIQFEIELRGLDPAMNQPKRPFLVILGGTKLETKLPLIEKLTNRVDIICVGGKLAAELVARPNESRKLIIAKMTTDGLDIGKDSIDQFTKGGRSDLADSEKAELAILETYLPAQMSKDEVLKIAEAKKNEMAITDKSKSGQLMSAIMKELKGKADGNLVKSVVDEILGS